VLDQLEQLGANGQHLLACAARPQVAGLNQGAHAEPQREELGQRAGLSAHESPAAAAAERPCCCSWRPSWWLSPLRRAPWGYRRTPSAVLEDQGGRGAASWPIGHGRFFATAPPARIWPMADVGVVVETANRPSSAVPRAGRKQSQDLRLVSPALLEGAEAAFAA